MSILSVNAGSSSLKFALYPIQGAGIGPAEMTGNIEGLEPAGQPCMSWSVPGEAKSQQTIEAAAGQDVFDALVRQVDRIDTSYRQ